MLLPVAAQAADLPGRKSAPVEYVRVCDAYGAGFYWIPGTDTCLKIGGRVRVDSWYTPAKNAVQMRSAGGPAYAGPPGGGNASATFVSANAVDSIGWYARAILTMDARTQSAWGTVQTAMTLRFAAQSGLAQTAPYLGYASGLFANAGTNAPTFIEAAYIRFAGFTIGQAATNFQFLTVFPLHTPWFGSFPGGTRQIAYTASFGSGLSATLALENRGDMPQSGTAGALGFNPWSATAATATGNGPQRLPAVVANVRLDQSWGAAMVSGAVLENTANFATPAVQATTGGTGPMMRKTGWAVGAGLRVNLPMIAAGDHFQGWISYGVGALDYVAFTGINSNLGFTASYLGGFLRADRNMTIYCPSAGCTRPGAEQTGAFNIAGIFTHYWTPSLRSHFFASLVRLTPGTVTRNTDWTNGGLSTVTSWSTQGSLIWSPVRNFDLGVELSYARLSQRLAGFAGGAPTAVPCAPASPMCLANISPGNWTVRMRAERVF